MKVIMEKPEIGEDDHIVIKCHNITPELLNLINAIKSHDNMLVAYKGNEIHRTNPSDIFFIETVDNKTFLYCKDDVYESKQRLYELEEALASSDFMRISKSTIVNLSKVSFFVPALSGRMQATLQNNEKVIISRQYVGDLKKKLGIK